jgi:hypothetical protein
MMKKSWLVTLAPMLVACEADVFTRAVDDSGHDAREASPLDAQVSETSEDAGGLDARDAGMDSPTPDADAAKCEAGTTACHATWEAYCARLKSCCSGGCVSSWANNGGSECTDHFLSNTNSYCTGRANDLRCDETCLLDIQFATCQLVTGQASIYGISKISSACMAYWQ